MDSDNYYNDSTELFNSSTDLHNYFMDLAGTDRLDDLKILIKNDVGGIIDFHYGVDVAFRSSCEYGNLEVTKYLMSLEDKYGVVNIHACDDQAFISSCDNNLLEVVKYLCTLYEGYRYDIIDDEIIPFILSEDELKMKRKQQKIEDNYNSIFGVDVIDVVL